MARQARKHSGTGIYHVMLRGINRQDIFEDDEDYMMFIRILSRIVNREGQGHGDRYCFKNQTFWIKSEAF